MVSGHKGNSNVGNLKQPYGPYDMFRKYRSIVLVKKRERNDCQWTGVTDGLIMEAAVVAIGFGNGC